MNHHHWCELFKLGDIIAKATTMGENAESSKHFFGFYQRNVPEMHNAFLNMDDAFKNSMKVLRACKLVGSQYVRLSCDEPQKVKLLGDSRYESDPFVTSRPTAELYNNLVASPRSGKEPGSPKHLPGNTSPDKGASKNTHNDNVHILVRAADTANHNKAGRQTVGDDIEDNDRNIILNEVDVSLSQLNVHKGDGMADKKIQPHVSIADDWKVWVDLCTQIWEYVRGPHRFVHCTRG